MECIGPQLTVSSALPRLELFHHNIRAFLTHEATAAPSPSYFVVRYSAACPTPDRFIAGEEVGVLL
jgi:hypothetical protein